MEYGRYCEHLCSARLSDNTVAPYNSIRELQSFASTLSLLEPHPPRITLAPDVQTFFIHGQGFHVPTFRLALRTLFNEAKDGSQQVLRHKHIPIHIPNDLYDDMTNTTRGYSWLDNARFTDVEYP